MTTSRRAVRRVASEGGERPQADGLEDRYFAPFGVPTSETSLDTSPHSVCATNHSEAVMFFLILLAVLAVIAIAATVVAVRNGGYGSVANRPGAPLADRDFDSERRDSRW
ncbi:hypothetical protein [Subtercola endophyticus]|uniref:hypothetical protein n=1 Tax=Subtercola endophyticus TaxID=2895559 RepID=UPI001E64A9CB|nr:hypothetical protein [Subtercola endophyticus]UFS60577.1 hypothetical protein LQ955_07500 [Subtercola endophyticus]